MKKRLGKSVKNAKTRKKLRERIAKTEKQFRSSKVAGARAKHMERFKSARQKAIARKLAGKHAILRDTGIMFAALNPTFNGAPGALERNIPFGIEVGYGGPGGHGKDHISVSDLAEIHDKGLGRVPKRQIIVEPSPQVVAAMTGDMKRALDKLERGE